MKRAKAIEVSAAMAGRERHFEEAFLTRPELARRHRTTIETIKRRQAKGIYNPHKIGRSVLYKLSEIVAVEDASDVR
jgi:hypothetical protein